MMTYTDEVVSLTSEIRKVRGNCYISKVTDYRADYQRLQELNRELWALENDYVKINEEEDPCYISFKLVVYYWCATIFMIIYGGGL